MICVGIDVSKGKSTVCIMKPYGEVIYKPFEIMHYDEDLNHLVSIIKNLNDEVKVVMEATGIYHLPVLTYLQEKQVFTSVINPYAMKKYRNQAIRKGKTDKLDYSYIRQYILDEESLELIEKDSIKFEGFIKDIFNYIDGYIIKYINIKNEVKYTLLYK